MPIEFYIAALHNLVLSDAFNEVSEEVLDVELDILKYAHGLISEAELKARIIEALNEAGVQL